MCSLLFWVLGIMGLKDLVFITAKTWEQPRCASAGNRLWNIIIQY